MTAQIVQFLIILERKERRVEATIIWVKILRHILIGWDLKNYALIKWHLLKTGLTDPVWIGGLAELTLDCITKSRIDRSGSGLAGLTQMTLTFFFLIFCYCLVF